MLDFALPHFLQTDRNLKKIQQANKGAVFWMHHVQLLNRVHFVKIYTRFKNTPFTLQDSIPILWDQQGRAG